MIDSDDPRVQLLKAEMHKILDAHAGAMVTPDTRRLHTMRIERDMHRVLRHMRLHDRRCAGLPPVRGEVVWSGTKASITLIFLNLSTMADQLRAAQKAGEDPYNVLRTADGDDVNPDGIFDPDRAKA